MSSASRTTKFPAEGFRLRLRECESVRHRNGALFLSGEFWVLLRGLLGLRAGKLCSSGISIFVIRDYGWYVTFYNRPIIDILYSVVK